MNSLRIQEMKAKRIRQLLTEAVELGKELKEDGWNCSVAKVYDKRDLYMGCYVPISLQDCEIRISRTLSA